MHPHLPAGLDDELIIVLLRALDEINEVDSRTDLKDVSN